VGNAGATAAAGKVGAGGGATKDSSLELLKAIAANTGVAAGSLKKCLAFR